MNLNKIIGLVAIALALVAAFVTVPYVAPILGVIGLAVGFGIVRDDHVRVLVSALVLTYLADTFDGIPAAGSYITMILGNFADVAAGAAIMIVLRNVYTRFKP